MTLHRVDARSMVPLNWPRGQFGTILVPTTTGAVELMEQPHVCSESVRAPEPAGIHCELRC